MVMEPQERDDTGHLPGRTPALHRPGDSASLAALTSIKALAVAAVESYFVWRVALAFVNDRRYADMSASSWPLSVGSLGPCFVA
jgi:hypothetical protein